MLYFHNIRFQKVMQTALQRHISDRDIFPRREGSAYERVLARMPQKPSIKAGTLRKFCTAQWPELGSDELSKMSVEGERYAIAKESNARIIWDYLSLEGEIERALKPNESKKLLFSTRMIATAMMSYYECHEARIEKFSELGISGETGAGPKTWFAYKMSSMKTGYMVKSEFSIDNINDEYFEIMDKHFFSGRFSASKLDSSVYYTGFAYVRSDKLWCHMRDIQYSQPRTICLFEEEVVDRDILGATVKKIVQMHGQVIENDRVGDSGFSSFRIALVDADVDQSMIEREVSTNNQLDARCALPENNGADYYPIFETERSKFQDELAFHIPSVVYDYVTGN